MEHKYFSCVPANIAYYAAARGASKKDLAAAMRVNPSTLSRKLNRDAGGITLSELDRAAKYLCVDMTALVAPREGIK